MSQTEFDYEKYAADFAEQSPRAIMELALETFEDIAISFSGAEDVVLVDLASKIK